MDVSGLLAWLVIGLFLAGRVFEDRRPDVARYVQTIGWVGFGVFWATLIPYYLYEMHSAIETLLSAVAVPASLHTARLRYRGRESLSILSHSIGYMGLIYLTFNTVPVFREWLIETVAMHTYLLMSALGYAPTLGAGPIYGYQSAFTFTGPTGHDYYTYIELACTGVGSIAIFLGALLPTRAETRNKLIAAVTVTAVIYVLNLVRNAFIAVAFGKQWFQSLAPVVMSIVGYSDPRMVSFFVADRVIGQFMSLVALLLIGAVILRQVPDLSRVVEEAVYVLTGHDITIDFGE